MNTWTVYRRPADYPDCYVARRWQITNAGAIATDEMFTADTLEEVRALLPSGLVRMTRHPDDEPVIVEVWL